MKDSEGASKSRSANPKCLGRDQVKDKWLQAPESGTKQTLEHSTWLVAGPLCPGVTELWPSRTDTNQNSWHVDSECESRLLLDT